MVRIKLNVSGMHCSSCAFTIEKSLLKIQGVFSVNVHYSLGTVLINCAKNISTQELCRAIEQAGYKVEQSSIREEKNSYVTTPKKNLMDEEKKIFFRFVVSMILSLPLLLMMLFPDFLHKNWKFLSILQAFLCLAVIVFSGWNFYEKAFQAVKNRRANMECLISLGVFMAFFVSLIQMFDKHPTHLHFETAAIILTLINFGQYLTEKAKRLTNASLLSLIELEPQAAEIISSEGKIKTIKPSQLKMGDIVLVKPGGIIPCDGVIVNGESYIDESIITGENIPVFRSKGNFIFTGATNADGSLEIEVKKTGDKTRLSSIKRLVEEAHAQKPNIQKFVDRICAIFVPTILCIALLTFFFWFYVSGEWKTAIECMIAVLVISCPCALGLATPAALIAGTGAAARSGILIRDLNLVEEAHNINLIAFDKTGTLTSGKPTVLSVFSIEKNTKEILTFAAALEQYSMHPLAKAVVAHVKNLGLDIPRAENVTTLGGLGLIGYVDSHKIILGNERLCLAQGIQEDEIKKISPIKKETCSFILIDHRLAGFIEFGDHIRPEALCVINQLSKQGITTIMLTGDNEFAAKKVAESLGIVNIYANLNPEEKIQLIEKLSHKGKILFIGDGLNDAPALAKADIGIAFSSGIHATQKAAAIVLIRPDLTLIPATLDILSQIRQTIQKNLFWAFLYNIIAIPLAAFGFLPPILASIAMILSSLCVAGNSFLLSRWIPKEEDLNKH